IPYYLEKEKAPIMGFTPDCKYPVVYGEKGMAKIRIKSKINYEGGFTGEYIIRTLEEKELKTDFIKIKSGFSRINVKIKALKETE
ncbi:peptidase M20, partial [Clostridioides difficile]